MPNPPSHMRIDVDFTLALNNATGKFYFCRDMIASTTDLINQVLYWRLAFATQPKNLNARVLGRLAVEEINLRRTHPRLAKLFPKLSRRNPVLFTDPREVIFHNLKPSDIILCHDVGPITHPELYHPAVKQTYALAYAAIERVKPFMMFVSEASRSEFCHLYGTNYSALALVHPPLRQGITNGATTPVPGLPARFFLTVGAIGTRKNQARSIAAFEQSRLVEQGFGYVICGGPEPGFEAVKTAATQTQGIHLPGYVSDEQLRWLYQNAAGFILPSLLEGFGLPAAEAINYNLIPLVGRGGALHEVTGDAAILVDPTDITSIADGMTSLAALSDEQKLDRLARARSSISRFTSAAAVSTWRATLQKALAARSTDN